MSEQGHAARVELVRSSGVAALDAAAQSAVAAWTFVPARHGSVAVAEWIEVPVRFRLQSK